jgi:hypothetical protein
VEGVDSDSHVEGLLSGSLHDVLVGADTSGLESLGRKLLILVRDKVAAEGEVIDGSLLSTKIVDSDLGVGDTTVVSGLGEPRKVRLRVLLVQWRGCVTKHDWVVWVVDLRLVLTVSVATSWTTTHFDELYNVSNAPSNVLSLSQAVSTWPPSPFLSQPIPLINHHAVFPPLISSHPPIRLSCTLISLSGPSLSTSRG